MLKTIACRGIAVGMLAVGVWFLPGTVLHAAPEKNGDAAQQEVDGNGAVRLSVKRMMTAMMGEDAKSITEQLWAENDLERQAAEAWAGSMTGQFRLRRLVREKFGPDGMREYDPRVPADAPLRPTKPEEVEKQVEQQMKGAQVKVAGERARVTLAADPKRPMELKKEGAEWKPVYSSVNPPKMSEKSLRDFIRYNGYWGPNYHKTADEVEAGKYKSGAEVRAALDKRQADSAAAIAAPF